MRSVSIVLLLVISSASAQIDTTHLYDVPGYYNVLYDHVLNHCYWLEGKLLSKDSSFYYLEQGEAPVIVKKNRDTDSIIYMTKDSVVLVTGHVRTGCPGKCFGKWTAYYLNGQKKFEGSFYKWGRLKEGIWTTYYDNGKINTMTNYSIVHVSRNNKSLPLGDYVEYYPSGILKVKGQYHLYTCLDTTAATNPDPPYNLFDYTYKSKCSGKHGKWLYYDENGILVREEKYKAGSSVVRTKKK